MLDYNSYENNIFYPMEAKIVNAKQVTELEKHFTLKLADDKQMSFSPGQIMEVSLFGYGEIPIGFASSPTRKNTFDIVVRSVGRVSKAINKLEKGDSLYVRGPLGSGFDLKAFKNQNVLIVAGGIGLCPTRSMIQYILDKRADFKKFTLLYGSKNPKQRMFVDDLAAWSKSNDVDFHETVDSSLPGWKGNVGLITTLFKNLEIDSNTKVIVCGPPVMFKFVIFELQKFKIKNEDIFLDLERRMKCGVGKCGHCQINDHYACIHGPVFSLATIKHLEEAI